MYKIEVSEMVIHSEKKIGRYMFKDIVLIKEGCASLFIKDENGEIQSNSNSSGGVVEKVFQQLQNTHAAGEIRA